MAYLKSIHFEKVYIVSDHENLYEKYGFNVIDRKIAPWGSEEKIYVQRLKKKKKVSDFCGKDPRFYVCCGT